MEELEPEPEERRVPLWAVAIGGVLLVGMVAFVATYGSTPESPGRRLADRSAGVGYLNLTVRPVAEVTIDGTDVPQPTPLKGHALLPGPHTVVLRDPATGRTRTLEILIHAGRSVTRILDFEKARSAL